MSAKPENLVDLAASAGPPPADVDLSTWLIASLPPGELSRAAKYRVPSYEELARDQKEGAVLARFMAANPMPEAKLGQDIIVKQQQLSKTRRAAATAACALTFFAGGTAWGYEAVTTVDKDVGVHATATDRIERGAIVGGVAGPIGGVVMMFVALSQAGRLARRPAQRIVRRAARAPRQ